MSNFVRPLARSVLVLMLVAAVKPIYGSMAPPADSPELPRPSSELQPGEVVQIVIDALGKNNYPFTDAGIETAFNFSSPANKVNTGPLERFVKLVKGPVFGKMINHRDSTLSKVVLEGNKALRLVQIVGANNETLYFAFRLGLQQEGDYAGMWLTEAVWPLEAPKGDVIAL
ncbi:MAG: DUF4864 domain-containing protein [Gammaproteobacteria bacterium]|jgi:hypothetical protein|nr:DUF4864 domain-containing protein [Gammaproteobacteria bacterium]